MFHSKKEIEAVKKIKNVLDEGIQSGPWQANLYLKGIKKKLEEIRDQFKVDLGLDGPNWSDSRLGCTSELALDDAKEVYISLYQSQGSNIQKWQQVIASLVQHSIGRPVYNDENEAKAATFLRDKNPNNAYVVLKINADAIAAEERPRLDREGRKLIKLKDGAIRLHNITCLVHLSGRYKLIGNFLVKQV